MQDKPYSSHEQSFYHMLMQAPVAIVVFKGSDYVIELANDLYLTIAGKTREELINKPAFEAMPAATTRSFIELLNNIRSTGKPFKLHEHETLIDRKGEVETTWLNIVYQPLKELDGSVDKIMTLVTEVTEQVLARKKLEESETRFRSLPQNSPDIITRHDKDFRYLYANPLIKNYTGLNAEEFPGKTYRELGMSEDLCAFFDEQLQKVFTDKIPHTVEYHVPDNAGTIIHSRMMPEFNEKGEMISVLVLSTDISQSKKTELALKNAKDQLELTFQNVPSAIYHFDKHGNILYLNEKGANQMGYATVDEVLAVKNVFQLRKQLDETYEILDEAGKPLPVEKSSAALAFSTQQPSEVVANFVDKKSGAAFWLLSKSSPLFDEKGELSVILTTSTDITPQKTSEQFIRQSEENFRLLADMVPQIIWTARPDGYLDYYNKRWYEYTCFEEGFGDQSWTPILHPEDVQFCVDTWYNAVLTGEPYHIEYRFIDRSNSGFRWFLGKALPIKNNDGKVLKWFGTCTDIHDQKMLSERLENLVADRTKELQRSNDDLQQFAHVASHDLKEPVRKIRIFGSRMIEEFGEALPPKAKLYMTKIESAAERMYSMIEGVLLYSTLDALEQTIGAIDLKEMFHNIELDLEMMITQKKAIIQYDNLPKIEGSSVLIYQLFYNLIHNSLKFSKTNESPVIQISAEIIKGNPSISNQIFSHNYYKITVKDNGIGFDDQNKNKIFKTFLRLNSKDSYEGTGLGLSLCKKIVERHGGTIEAEGDEGMGATLIIFLPYKSR